MAGTGAWGEAEVGMGVEEGHMFQDTDSVLRDCLPGHHAIPQECQERTNRRVGAS